MLAIWATLFPLPGTRGANYNLLLQLAMGAALLVGTWLARRQRFRSHHACQTLVVVLNLVLIALVMAPSFYSQRILSHAISHPGRAYFMTALLHAIVGTAAVALAVWVVVSAGTGLLPERWRMRRYKLWMRTTLALWLVALALGLLTYKAWY